MKKKILVPVIVCIVAVVFFAVGYFAMDFILDKIEANREANKIVYSEEETVTTSVAKFNTKILDSGMEVPVYEENLSAQSETYYYPLYEDVVFYSKPVTYTGDPTKDISYSVGIFYPVDSKYADIGKEYTKQLLKANNESITDEEALSIMAEAEELSATQEFVDRNNGLMVRYFNGDNDFYEFLIGRVYNIPAEEAK